MIVVRNKIAIPLDINYLIQNFNLSWQEVLFLYFNDCLNWKDIKVFAKYSFQFDMKYDNFAEYNMKLSDLNKSNLYLIDEFHLFLNVELSENVRMLSFIILIDHVWNNKHEYEVGSFGIAYSLYYDIFHLNNEFKSFTDLPEFDGPFSIVEDFLHYVDFYKKIGF